ncbi:mkiaa0324 protein-like protein [Leishmania major strain Friedlin]|uniref:Mkiaa0324 protein-like protein n=1 Tax=Leishmania major TaxID=5664 RepID=Q4Q0H9_LEIMA|nr:mkiaa0324 protein-like protein [Leishmania major strain Friedlin]CAG9584136.1 mkiaa0324_protein-like_protein [Leishmania major strain Friedlin]CAJ09556.1 mkiaa0324 protein-like protein [Leishmania major strain Friedlin]|eukprot:XP_001687169.1 mkiaa0324 protein-like protein [Leishmania major strain Friedlin]
MFSRSMRALVSRRPPFASFYKAVYPPLRDAEQERKMQTAAVLWHRTAPQYGIRFSAPRVAAALRIYRTKGKEITKELQKTAKPAGDWKAAPSRSKLARTTASKRKTIHLKRRQQKGKKAITPFAAFETELMRRTKFPSTRANLKRVLRMWIMTGRQRSLSVPKRVEMAVRLLQKDRKRAKRFSRTMSKTIARRRSKRATRKSARRSATGRSRKAAKSRKPPVTAARAKKAQAARPSRSAAAQKLKRARRMRAARRVPKRPASVKVRRARHLAAKRSSPKTVTASKPKARTTHAARKAAALKRRIRQTRIAAVAKSKARRTAAKRKTSAARRRANPYIKFYRHMRMTGLIPNQPKILGTRQIKALWTETHSLNGLNRRIARATELLEKRTGLKSKVNPPPVRTSARKRQSPKHGSPGPLPAPAAPKTLESLTIKQRDIKVPPYYSSNPFGATYAALLPLLRDIPSSTRMAHVAKAWTRTSVRDDKRSAKARIAAVAEAMKK